MKTVQISDGLWERLKGAAFVRRVTLTAVVSDACERWLWVYGASGSETPTLLGIPAIVDENIRGDYLGLARTPAAPVGSDVPAPLPQWTPNQRAALTGIEAPVGEWSTPAEKRAAKVRASVPGLKKGSELVHPQGSDVVEKNTAIIGSPAADPWGVACGRCGHPRRAHLLKGEPGRCTFGTGCPCRAFVEPTGEVF